MHRCKFCWEKAFNQKQISKCIRPMQLVEPFGKGSRTMHSADSFGKWFQFCTRHSMPLWSISFEWRRPVLYDVNDYVIMEIKVEVLDDVKQLRMTFVWRHSAWSDVIQLCVTSYSCVGRMIRFCDSGWRHTALCDIIRLRCCHTVLCDIIRFCG